MIRIEITKKSFEENTLIMITYWDIAIFIFRFRADSITPRHWIVAIWVSAIIFLVGQLMVGMLVWSLRSPFLAS